MFASIMIRYLGSLVYPQKWKEMGREAKREKGLLIGAKQRDKLSERKRRK
jgi:hypothetical protein